MAIAPGKYDMTIQRRSDHNIQLVFKDSNNDAISLNGYTVQAQVWEETRKLKYADFAVTYTNRGTGTVDIALTDTQTLFYSLYHKGAVLTILPLFYSYKKKVQKK